MRRFALALFLSGLALMLACGGAVTETMAPEDREAAAAEGSATVHSVDEAARGTAAATIGGAEIAVEYGRPNLEGRDMRGQARPGAVWRLGMNEASTLKTDKPLKFGDIEIPAGEYTIFARMIEAGNWELIFHSQLGLWGAYDHDPAKDVASVPLQSSSLDESVEKFTIGIESTGDNTGKIAIQWGADQLAAGFTVN